MSIDFFPSNLSHLSLPSFFVVHSFWCRPALLLSCYPLVTVRPPYNTPAPLSLPSFTMAVSHAHYIHNFLDLVLQSGGDIQDINIWLQEKNWLTPGLIDEISTLFPTASDVNPSTGEHDKDTFVVNCNELFLVGCIFWRHLLATHFIYWEIESKKSKIVSFVLVTSAFLLLRVTFLPCCP